MLSVPVFICFPFFLSYFPSICFPTFIYFMSVLFPLCIFFPYFISPHMSPYYFSVFHLYISIYIILHHYTHEGVVKVGLGAIISPIIGLPVFASIYIFLSGPFVPQNLIRELEGIHIIAGFLSDPAPEVRVQALNALNNLCMNIENQEQIKVSLWVYCSLKLLIHNLIVLHLFCCIFCF